MNEDTLNWLKGIAIWFGFGIIVFLLFTSSPSGII
jgi:hypothetical protein